MKINKLSLHRYKIPLTTGDVRHGILLNIVDESGKSGWGETAPLPKWSQETLEQAIQQIHQKKSEILSSEWTANNCFDQLKNLALLPSVSFGLESALLSMLSPLPDCSLSLSALFMGKPDEILQQAKQKSAEGYTSAKLKVSQLSFDQAHALVSQLKDTFRLRIDVNRAWKTKESLAFFSRYSNDAFDYVEEPFQNPKDLHLFPGPLAVDESYPLNLSLDQLEALPSLKAIIYKPTMQGGIIGLLPLRHLWKKIVLSSSFESDMGLLCVASIVGRLGLGPVPVGLGTHDYMGSRVLAKPLEISKAKLHVPSKFTLCVSQPTLEWV